MAGEAEPAVARWTSTLQPDVFHHRDGLILVVDKGYRDHHTETWLNERGITVIRPAYRTEEPRPGRALLHAVRQRIESVNNTLKSQLSLEQHADARSLASRSGYCNASSR